MVVHSLFRLEPYALFIAAQAHFVVETLIVTLPNYRQASVLDHSKHPCKENFIPNTKVCRTIGLRMSHLHVFRLSLLCSHTQGKVYVMYIAMENNKDFDNWMKLATVGPHCPQHVAQ